MLEQSAIRHQIASSHDSLLERDEFELRFRGRQAKSRRMRYGFSRWTRSAFWFDPRAWRFISLAQTVFRPIIMSTMAAMFGPVPPKVRRLTAGVKWFRTPSSARDRLQFDVRGGVSGASERPRRAVTYGSTDLPALERCFATREGGLSR